MKLSHRPATGPRNGFTLLEMTIVIMVLLALVKIGLFTSTKMDEWKLGRSASETLRKVYAAQRMYLADNPVTSVADLTDLMLIPYLPNVKVITPQPTTLKAALPAVKSLTGAVLGFRINDTDDKKPAVYLTDSGGALYDPTSPAPDYPPDSLWDIGE